MNKLSNQKGFTLVEIAIVLVIIGLLLGGVLKGQELIKNAKINSLIQDFKGVATAYYAYLDRTGEVPGGAGSEIVADKLFWSALRKEGFISGDTAFLDNGIEPIQLAFMIGVGVSNTSVVTGPRHVFEGNFLANGPSSFFETNYICASNIDVAIAQGIDRKLDDGQPGTGSIRTGINIEVSTDPLDMIPGMAVSGGYPEGLELPSTLCKAL